MSEHLEFNTEREVFLQKRVFRNRLFFGYAFVLILFGVLIGRMAFLQWHNYERYHGLAEGNRISIETLPPTRGKIYDRNHVLLADNQPVYILTLVREKMGDIDATRDALKQILADVPPEKLDDFFAKFKKGNRAKTYTIPFSLSEQQAAAFSVVSHNYPGVTLDARLKRIYPQGSTAVHALGYVGRINAKELTKLDEKIYRGTDIIGKTGIEKFYEPLLHGTPGIQQIETNARGRVLRKLDTLPSIAGQDIHLTIDIKLQNFAESLFEDTRGGLIAINPQNGEILAFVSMPTFDPNLFVDGIDQKTYTELLNNPTRPFINRAINGQYPPGSTIKPFVALGAIERNIITPNKKIFDPGYLVYKEHTYRDWKRTGHGMVNMNTAIVESCDTYFYELSLNMGVDTIHDALSPFGFGETTNVDLYGESKGILPSQEWKQVTKRKPWYRGETIISAIGQGYNLTTPIQLAKATAILANRGKIIQPHLLKRPQTEPLQQVEIKKITNWEQVITAMADVMHSEHGTARKHGEGLPFKMAGKTGTAQVFSLNEADYVEEDVAKALRDHSLFVGFAPVENPKIAVSVIVENAGSGSKTAAPMAVELIKKYLEMQNQSRETLKSEVTP